MYMNYHDKKVSPVAMKFDNGFKSKEKRIPIDLEGHLLYFSRSLWLKKCVEFSRFSHFFGQLLRSLREHGDVSYIDFEGHLSEQ